MFKNIKKLFCLTTVLALVCTSFVFATEDKTAESNSAPDSWVTDAMEVLRLFEIIPDYYDYNTDFSEVITRGDFVDVVGKLINIDANANATGYYYDVPKTHYAYQAISTLTEMNIIGGTGDNLFKPDDSIDPDAAYKIILTIMGYKDHAELDGGYPLGYRKLAKRLDFANVGEDVSGCVTRSEMMVLIYDAMTAPMYIPEKFDSIGATDYKTSSDDTLLSTYRDVYYRRGVVNVVGNVSINGQRARDEKSVVIDDTEYNAEVSVMEYLGEEVDYFVKHNKISDEYTLMWAKPSGNSEKLEISREDTVGFDKNTFELSYTYKDKVKKIVLDRGLTLVYNNNVVEKDFDKYLDRKDVSVKLIKNDGKYKIAFVKSYVNYVAGSVSKSDMVVYDKYASGKKVVLDENLYDYFVMTRGDGSSSTVEEINIGDVLSVFSSVDGKYLEVIVYQNPISGKLTHVKDSDLGKELTVNNSAYTVLKGTESDAYEVGDNVTLYLDYCGYVAYVSKSASALSAAYIIDGTIEKGGFGNEVLLKVLKVDGTVSTHYCAEELKGDGKTLDNINDIVELISEDGVVKPQLVMLNVNKDEEIDIIDTVNLRSGYEVEDGTLSLNVEASSVRYRGSGYLGPMSAVQGTTPLFKVPTGELKKTATDKDYVVSKVSSLTDNEIYYVSTYKLSTAPGYCDFVVEEYNSAPDYNDSLPILVTGISQSMNESGELVECLEGYQGGSEVTLEASRDYSYTSSGVKKGMLVRARKDYDDSICEVKIVYDPDKGITSNTSNQYNALYGAEIGYINDVSGNIMTIGYQDPTKVNRVLLKASAPVIVYDKDNEREPVKKGEFADAVTYRNNPDDCSVVVAVSRYTTQRLFVIYK